MAEGRTYGGGIPVEDRLEILLGQHPSNTRDVFKKWMKKAPTGQKKILEDIYSKWGIDTKPHEIAELLKTYKHNITECNSMGEAPLDLLIMLTNREKSQLVRKSCILVKVMVELGASPSTRFIENIFQKTVIEVLSRKYPEGSFTEYIPSTMPILIQILSLDIKDNDVISDAKCNVVTKLVHSFRGAKLAHNTKHSFSNGEKQAMFMNIVYLMKHAIKHVPPEQCSGEIVLTLLQLVRGAPKVFGMTIMNEDCISVLQDTIEYMLNGGLITDINHVDSETGQTVLHVAAEAGLEPIVRLLLSVKDINFNAQDKMHATPLIHLLHTMRKQNTLNTSSAHSYLNITDILSKTEGVNFEQVDTKNATALTHCILLLSKCEYYMEQNTFQTLLSESKDDIKVPIGEYYSPLWLCAKYDLYKEAKILLEEHPRLLEARDSKERTPLHIAALNSSDECIKLFIEKDKTLCNKPDLKGNTSLFYLVTHCNVPLAVDSLKNYSWDFAVQNNVHENALAFYQAFCDGGKRGKPSEAIKDILKMHLPTNQAAGETLRQKDSNLRITRMFQSFRKQRVPPVHNDEEDSRTPLKDIMLNMSFAQRLFRALLQKTECLASLYKDKTVLMMCAQHGMEEEMKMVLDKMASEDVNYQDKSRRSALHIAVVYEQQECVRILVTSDKVDKTLKDSTSRSALFYIPIHFPADPALQLLDPDNGWEFAEHDSLKHTVLDHYMSTMYSKSPSEELKTFLTEHCPATHIRRSTASTPSGLTASTTQVEDKWEPPTDAISIGAAAAGTTPALALISERSDYSQAHVLNSSSRDVSLPSGLAEWVIRFEEMRVEFVRDFTKSPKLFDHFIQKRMFTSVEMTRWKGDSLTDEDVARELADLLPKKGGECFRKFYDALKGSMPGNEQIVMRIREKIIPLLPPPPAKRGSSAATGVGTNASVSPGDPVYSRPANHGESVRVAHPAQPSSAEYHTRDLQLQEDSALSTSHNHDPNQTRVKQGPDSTHI